MTLLLSLLLTASPCTTSTDGGTVITCGEARVMVSITPGEPAQSLPAVVEGMTKIYAATETKRGEAVVGAKKLEAIEITFFTSQKDKTPMGHAIVTALPEKNSKVLSRVLVCMWESGRQLEACTRGFALGATVANPQAPTPSLPNEQRAWTGLELTAPAGCKTLEPGNIVCKEASLLWGDRPPDGPLNSQRLLAEMALGAFPPGTTITERPCKVGGKSTSCTVLSGTMKGMSVSAIIALGEVNGRSTSMQCLAGDVKVMPAPCNLLLSW